MLCEDCGKDVEVGDWPFCPHPSSFKQYSGGNGFPFTTSNLTGKPIEVTSESHLKALCKAHGVVHRPDNAWIEKRQIGTDWKTGKPIYSEPSGRGMKGSWI
jgi:hypothetical protein